MDNMVGEIVNQLKKANGGHIYYSFTNIDNYLENAVSYIVDGIGNDEHILLVENDRNIRLINRMLSTKLNKVQLQQVHFMNNFDFYFSNGDFHPHTVFQHFVRNVEPYLKGNVVVRTWGLIEWKCELAFMDQVEEYEKKLDSFLKTKENIISVCAYDANRTPECLREALMRCHDVLMSDDEFIYTSATNKNNQITNET